MATAVAERKKETKAETPLVRDPWDGFGVGFGSPSLSKLRKEFDDLWTKFFTGMPAPWAADRADSLWSFHVDDQADAYVVHAEAPGFDAKDFQIELRGDQLVMQAKKSEKKKDHDAECFEANEFYHSMILPPYIDADHIQASYNKGKLSVTVPKSEKGKPRAIHVKG